MRMKGSMYEHKSIHLHIHSWLSVATPSPSSTSSGSRSNPWLLESKRSQSLECFKSQSPSAMYQLSLCRNEILRKQKRRIVICARSAKPCLCPRNYQHLPVFGGNLQLPQPPAAIGTASSRRSLSPSSNLPPGAAKPKSFVFCLYIYIHIEKLYHCELNLGFLTQIQEAKV